MKPYKIVISVSVFIIASFILLPIILIALPCRVNIEFINNTDAVCEIIDSDGHKITEILPGNQYNDKQIGVYDGFYILNSSDFNYKIEFYDKDHWFAIKHNEIVIIEKNTVKFSGFLNWDYRHFEK